MLTALIDLPRAVPASEYGVTVQQVVRRLSGVSGVNSIYQVGHVSDPGISDLDLLVVFDSDARYREDPRCGLGPTGRYLLIHSLFGVTQRQVGEAAQLTFLQNYQLRWGEPQPVACTGTLSADEERLLKCQLALEYMLRIYASLFVQFTYRLLKVRSLLLHAKALHYDCDMLGMRSSPLRAAAARVADRRRGWFAAASPCCQIADDAAELCNCLGMTLADLLKEQPFFLAHDPPRRSSCGRHLVFRHGATFGISHRGLLLPPALGKFCRRYIGILDRLNHFDVVLPFSSALVPSVIQRTFALRDHLAQANRTVCPHFMPLSLPL